MGGVGCDTPGFPRHWERGRFPAGSGEQLFCRTGVLGQHIPIDRWEMLSAVVLRPTEIMQIHQTQVLKRAFNGRSRRAARLFINLNFRSGVFIFRAVDLAVKGDGWSPEFGSPQSSFIHSNLIFILLQPCSLAPVHETCITRICFSKFSEHSPHFLGKYGTTWCFLLFNTENRWNLNHEEISSPSSTKKIFSTSIFFHQF